MIVTSTANAEARQAVIRVIEEGIADLLSIRGELAGTGGTVKLHISRLEAERGWLLAHMPDDG